MKSTIILLVMSATIFTACSSKPKDPQETPQALAETIFDAARSGNYQGLALLIDINADGDSKMIAQAETDKTIQQEFQKYFAKGKVSADPIIEGEKASVNILFGPDGTKEETLEMIRKDGKWYLSSF